MCNVLKSQRYWITQILRPGRARLREILGPCSSEAPRMEKYHLGACDSQATHSRDPGARRCTGMARRSRAGRGFHWASLTAPVDPESLSSSIRIEQGFDIS